MVIADQLKPAAQYLVDRIVEQFEIIADSFNAKRPVTIDHLGMGRGQRQNGEIDVGPLGKLAADQVDNLDVPASVADEEYFLHVTPPV